MAIIRRRVAKKFVYLKDGDKITDIQEIERINKLAIPPAWKDVEIAVSKTAKVQAKGFDAAGRTQAIYNQTFRLKQDKLKFKRILQFAEKLPALRRQIEKDLKRKTLSREKVLSCIVKLIDEQFFRVGNDQYAKGNESYGITTLRSKHADITRTTVTFDFIGKSGKQHIKKISDPQIARIIQQLDELPGYEIFRYLDASGEVHDIHSADVNAYIKEHMSGDYTAKDFRTWGGTLLAVSALLAEDSQKLSEKNTKTVNAVIKQVAKRLGNTPAVAKDSYIDPRVFAAYEDGKTIPSLKISMTKMRPKKYITVDEQCVLKILSES